jgi:hypothetical protein
MSGNSGKAVVVILVIAAILFGLSSFAGDHETVALLQVYVIPFFTFLALIIAALSTAIRDDPQKGSEGDSAGIRVEQSTAPIEMASATKTKTGLSAKNVAFLSGSLAVLLVIMATILINSGLNVDWHHVSSPDQSAIEDVVSVGNGGILVKTNSGKYYEYDSALSSPAPCQSNCWHEITSTDWSNEVKNTNDPSCQPMALSKEPPVEQVNREFIFKKCAFDTNYTWIVIDEKGDLWFWDKTIVSFESLLGIVLFASIFVAPVFALIGVTLFKSFKPGN